jgi:hypothetical protein
MEYISNLPIDVGNFLQACLGGGSLVTVLKCKILGLLAAAEVFQVNHIYKHTEEKDAILFSKLQHPNGATQRL